MLLAAAGLLSGLSPAATAFASSLPGRRARHRDGNRDRGDRVRPGRQLTHHARRGHRAHARGPGRS